MKAQILHFEFVPREAFDGQFRFIYPGNGQFDFSKTIFNNNGDLLARTLHRPCQGYGEGHNQDRKDRNPGGPPSSSSSTRGGQPRDLPYHRYQHNLLPVYLSKITMDLDGKEDGSVLLSVLNFITGRKAKQNEVEVTVDTSPDTTKVSAMAPPDLTTTKLSARWSKATVAVRARRVRL